jgi:hypothetical protein
VLLDHDQQVETGVKRRWIEAQQAAYAAKKRYAAIIAESEASGKS